MRKVILFIVIVAVVSAGAAYVRSYANPCSRTLTYSMGSYDSRFGITQQQFIQLAQEMEKVWEEPLGRELFQYDPEAKFKLNLVFDERQQKTLDARAAKQKIDLKEDSYDKLLDQHRSLTYQHKQDLDAFNAQVSDYDQRLQQYNAQVSYWNDRGGAPSDEYKKLTQEKNALAAESRQMDSKRVLLNDQVKDLNLLRDRINEIAGNLNKDVNAYNGKFGEPKRFDQGTYTNNGINIYQFNDESDLKLVLAHEFGHALRLDHIDEPKAIMYYLMDQQDLGNIQLTSADINAINNVCGIK